MSHKNVVAPETNTVDSKSQHNGSCVTSSIRAWQDWNSELVEIRPGRYLNVCRHDLQELLETQGYDSSENKVDATTHAESKTTSRNNTASGVRINLLSRENSRCEGRLATPCDLPSSTTVQGHPIQRDSTPTVFLIHGVGGSVQTWQFQIAMLLDLHLKVVNFDLLGHGSSGVLHDSRAYVFQELAADVLAVFDKYSTTNNSLIAHSYGCRFAAFVAHQRPLLVNKLIFISGGSPLPLLPPSGPFILPVCILQCFHTAITSAFISRSYHGRIRTGVSSETIFRLPMSVLKKTIRGQYWPEGDLSFHQGISTQTLVIHGVNDELVLIPEAQLMNMTIPRSRLVAVDNAGHMVAMEAPDIVNDVIKQFLATDHGS